MHYLYRHIRKDKNEPFYIGIATNHCPTSKSWKTYYSRAYRKTKRSKFWNRITAVTDYEVEILFESEDRKFIEEKEKEFISLYGRKDLGTGCLANMTEGGDNSFNKPRTKEQIEKHRVKISGKNHRLYNKKQSEDTKKKLSLAHKELEKPENWGDHCRGGKNPMARKTQNVITGKIYDSFREACADIGIKWDYAQKRVKKDGEYKGLRYVDDNHTHKKKVVHLPTGKEYESLAEGCRKQDEAYNHQIKLMRENKEHRKFKYINN